MKKRLKNMLALVGTLVMVMTLTGCPSNAQTNENVDEKPAVCYVIANTANAQGIDYHSPLVQDLVTECARNYGMVAIVNADGNSQFMGQMSMDVDDRYKNASPDRLEKDAQDRAAQVLSYMGTLVADDPEVNYLEALRLACRAMSGLDGFTAKKIVVLGTGLSTAGNYLNFRDGLLSAEPAVIADMLEEREAIPDFNGCVVYWQGMCDTAAPQKDLTPAQRNRVEEIWREIITRGGGTLIVSDHISKSANASIDYPEVSVIDLPGEVPMNYTGGEITEDMSRQPIFLGEDQVQFVEGEAVYLNEEEAVKTIRPIAEYLLDHPDVRMLLIGTTAGDVTDEESIRLSCARGETVCGTLEALGVEADRLIAMGLGSDDPWHIANAGYTGPMASANRKVVLLDATTDQAKEILGHSEREF